MTLPIWSNPERARWQIVKPLAIFYKVARFVWPYMVSRASQSWRTGCRGSMMLGEIQSVLSKRLEDGMEMEPKWKEVDGRNCRKELFWELKMMKSENVQHTQTPVYQHQLRRVKNPCMPGRPGLGRVDSLIPYHLGIQFPMLHSFKNKYHWEIPLKQLAKKNSYKLLSNQKLEELPHHFRWMILAFDQGELRGHKFAALRCWGAAPRAFGASLGQGLDINSHSRSNLMERLNVVSWKSWMFWCIVRCLFVF